MSEQTKHWAEKQENGSYFAIRLLLWIYRFGGKWLILIVLGPILAYFFVKDSAARNASKTYLNRLHSHAKEQSPFSKAPGFRHAFYHFWQFALAALAKIDAWLGRITPDEVRYGGTLKFEDVLPVGSKRGAVLIGSHLGNQEVCRALVRSRHPVRINALAHTRHAAAFNKILKESNSEVDLRLIEVTELTPAVSMMLSECIERGELVVIVGDRISTQAPERAVWADFLGKKAPFAIGPWVLASVLQCPVYLMFCMKEQNGYNLMFEPFANEQITLARKTRQEELEKLTARYATELEKVAYRYPYQWFNFYDFWQLPKVQQKEQSGDSSSN